jgi:hypothetical protein
MHRTPPAATTRTGGGSVADVVFDLWSAPPTNGFDCLNANESADAGQLLGRLLSNDRSIGRGKAGRQSLPGSRPVNAAVRPVGMNGRRR